MNRLLAATVMVAAVVWSAAANGADDAGVAEGRALAQQLCARCHAIGETGESPFEPAPPFRSFGAKWPIDSLAEAFAEGIVVGHPAMPEFQFEPDQVDALLAYLENLTGQ